jgi:hypothetical protein
MGEPMFGFAIMQEIDKILDLSDPMRRELLDFLNQVLGNSAHGIGPFAVNEGILLLRLVMMGRGVFMGIYQDVGIDSDSREFFLDSFPENR